VRVIAIGIACRRDELLVMLVEDDAGRVKGARPPGGAVEFGERAAEALVREFREEFATDVAVTGPPAVLENLFTHEGAGGHEVVFAFPIRLQSPALTEQDAIVVDEGHRPLVRCAWHPVAAFLAGEMALYPDGLLAVLPGLMAKP
jgi:ADP-ribose pyrophosphatase YjhB (NUDIX family)